MTTLHTIIQTINRNEYISLDDSEYLAQFAHENLNHYIRNTTLEICESTETPWPLYQLRESLNGYVSTHAINNYVDWVYVEDADVIANRFSDPISPGPHSGTWFTDDYLAENATSCDHCGTLIWNFDAYNDDENLYCRSCYEDLELEEEEEEEDDYPSSNIHSYSSNILDYQQSNRKFFANRKWHAYPRNHLIYGVELETEFSHGRDRNQFANTAKNIPHIIAKSDGSLCCGIEIVTIPMDLAGHKSQMDWPNILGTALSNSARSKSSCGIHIHINRSALTELVLAKLLFFINAYTHRDFITCIAQRDFANNSYCGTDHEKSHASMAKTLKIGKNSCRYVAVNLTNARTVEIRIFAANLRIERVMKNLEFVDALIHYCIETSVAEINVSTFKTWTINHKPTYPNLINFLVEKGQIPPQPKKPARLAATIALAA